MSGGNKVKQQLRNLRRTLDRMGGGFGKEDEDPASLDPLN